MTSVLVEFEQPVISPNMEEAIRNGGEKLDAKIAESIDNLLCTCEQYAPGSAVYQTVAAELDVLCDGEDFTRPQLIVVRDRKDAVTAFSTPGYIVVGSNLVRQLAKEELDGLLAHELTHGVREHTKQRLAKSTQIEQVGRKRIGEFEADMLPLELLDRKGINPYGMISMFNKLETMQQAQKAQDPVSQPSRHNRAGLSAKHVRVDDYEHGSIIDRRVNTEEMLKIADVRHLSPGGLTKLPLSEADFDNYEHNTDLLARYNTLPNDEQRRLLIRELKSNNARAVSNRPQTLAMMHELIGELAPDLEPSDRTLATQLLDKKYPTRKQDTLTDTLDTNEALDLPAPEELVIRLNNLLQHPTLIREGVLRIDPAMAETVGDVVSASIEVHAKAPPAQTLVQLAQTVADKQPKFDLTVLWPAVQYLHTHEQPAELMEYTRAIAAFSDCTTIILDPGVSPADPFPDPRIAETNPEKVVYMRIAERMRISEAIQSTSDVVELMSLAASFGRNSRAMEPSSLDRGFELVDYPVYGLFEKDHNAEENEPGLNSENAIVQQLQTELASIDGHELLDLIRYHRRQGVLSEHDNRDFALCLWEEVNRYGDRSPALGVEAREGTAASLLDRSSYQERLVLAGLLTGKGNLLAFANTEFICEGKKIQDLLSEGKVSDAARQFQSRVKDLLNVHQKLERLGFGVDWQIYSTDLAQLPELQTMAFTLVTGLVKSGNITRALGIAEQVPLPSLDYLQQTTDQDVFDHWAESVSKLLQKDSPKSEEMMLLAVLGALSPNLHDRIDLPPRILQAIVGQMPLTEAVDFICDGLPALPRPLFLSAIEDLIERQASTPTELEYIVKRLGNRLLDFVDNQSAGVGSLSLVDGILLPNYGQKIKHERTVGIKRDEVHGLEARKLLIALLSTARSDEDLQNYMLERWWTLMRTNKASLISKVERGETDYGSEIDELSEAFKVEEILWLRGEQKRARREHWINDIPYGTAGYKPFQEVSDSTFRGGPGHKYYTLRKLLLDESYGVLRSPEDRTELIEQFLKNWLDNPADEAAKFVRDSLQSLTEVTDPELLYQHLYPLLMDIVLLLPEQRTDHHQLASQLAKQIFDDLLERGLLGHMSPESIAANTTLEALDQKVRGLVTGQAQVSQDAEKRITAQALSLYKFDIERANNNPETADSLRQEIKTYIREAIAMERERLTGLQANRDQIRTASINLRDRFAPETVAFAESQRMSALDLLFVLGERSGALGTRMLQLGGMYFDMPEDQREKFAHVYDDMKGQTRLQAWRTLNREATHSPAIHELLDNLVELKPRIGGGSLMTVYEAITGNGRREAIAVKNPNIEYHLGKIVLVLDRMLGDLQTKRADEYRIGLVQSLLEDVAEWINDELSDPTFEVKDAKFRAANDFRESQYHTPKNPYKILVPQSIPTGTRWVRREEYIEGRNLSGLAVVEDDTNIAEGKINTQDYRHAVSLLVHNYVYQLTETGLVHSDVHPGNFRITQDNQALAVFDRYNLLEFSDSERQVLRSVLRTVATGNMSDGMNAMINHMLTLPENASLDHQAVHQTVNSLIGESGDLTEVGPQLLLTLKQSGVKVPVKYTLVMKNILSLQRFSKKAGFNGIADAYLATADTSELLRLLQ